MKRFTLFLLIIGLAFFWGGCNTGSNNDDDGDKEKDPSYGEEGVFDWGSPGAMLDLTEDSNAYPGRELKLEDCPTRPETWGDISTYGEAILVAILYDEDGAKITTGSGQAQFNLLKGSGWDDANKLLVGVYNLLSDTPKSGTPKPDATGKPEKLLVQGSYETYEKGKVTKVEIKTLTLKPKTGLPSFTVVYGDGYVSTEGNKITFNNATYKEGAALYAFPPTFPSADALAGKKLVFNFKLEDMSATLEHQIHIQAAGRMDKEEDIKGFAGFGAQDDPQGKGRHQCYVTLDGNDGYDQTFSGDTGVFKIPFNELLALATVEGNEESKGYIGPFTLCAVRIVNNGTTWNDEGTVHNRNKSYSIIFNSITVE